MTYIDIKWYEWLYWINKEWLIINIKRWKLLSQQIDTKWYKVVILSKNNKKNIFRVHRLLATHFLETVEWKTLINHKDWNKLNNNLSNLEWCTYSENNIHAVNVLHKANYNRMKWVAMMDLDWNVIKEFKSMSEAWKYLWMKSNRNIRRVCIWELKTSYWYKWITL